MTLDALQFSDEAAASIADAQEYLRRQSNRNVDVASLAPLMAEARKQGFATDAELEATLIGLSRSGDERRLDAILHAATHRAIAMLEAAGFCAPAEAGDDRVHVDISGHQIEVRVAHCDLIELGALAQWSTPLTRRAVVKALHKIAQCFWLCNFARDLYGTSYYRSEAAVLVLDAAKKARGGKIDFDALWTLALDQLEHDEADEPGCQYLIGIGGREDFENWAESEIATRSRYAAFLSAPASLPVDRRRSAALRDWAERAERLCRETKCAFKGRSYMQGGECRDMGEAAIVVFGKADIDHLDQYFSLTDDQNGERPGVDLELGSDKRCPGGGPLVQGALLALVNDAVLGELRRIAA